MNEAPGAARDRLQDGDSRPARIAGSFRDPDGFMFWSGRLPFRQINPSFAPHLEALKRSGVLELPGMLPVEWLGPEAGYDAQAIATLRPEPLPFVSYPYEWSFGMLKAAALLTLDLAKGALERGLILKDASAYNICFLGSQPVHFDTLSFETYTEGEPWIAYGQFCRHFLAPLALGSLVSIELLKLLRIYLDGVPLTLASGLLPGKTKFNPPLAMHIHAHAKGENERASAEGSAGKRQVKVAKVALFALIDSLRSAVERLTWSPADTTWAEYTDSTNYSPAAYSQKQRIVSDLIAEITPNTVWDLGANTGDFSKIAADAGASVLAWDLDPGAIERHYRRLAESNDGRILPLLVDLANPSPDLGWGETEREGFFARANADLLLALALIHHLRIGNNTPLAMVAQAFARIAESAIVEWVPKEDSQVKRLLASREDIFDDYTEEGFRIAFETEFEIVRRVPVEGTLRVLYLLRRRAGR